MSNIAILKVTDGYLDDSSIAEQIAKAIDGVCFIFPLDTVTYFGTSARDELLILRDEIDKALAKKG